MFSQDKHETENQSRANPGSGAHTDWPVSATATPPGLQTFSPGVLAGHQGVVHQYQRDPRDGLSLSLPGKQWTASGTSETIAGPVAMPAGNQSRQP
jgi:hypothetical protein